MISLFDCHCDTVTTAMRYNEDIFDNGLHISLKRLSAFDRCAQVFAIWLDDGLIKNGFENTNRALDFFDECLKKHGDMLVKAVDKDTLSQCGKGKIAAVLSVEGGEGLGNKLENIDFLYKRGIRLITLTWNRENALGYGAATGSTKPLKPFGMSVLERMEQLGIIADVSHLNEGGFSSVCENAKMPFIASHSNAYALCANCRNLKDWQLKAIRDTGSMAGINIFPPFLNESGSAGLDDILRHAEYMGGIVGEDRLCMGCDFDGIDKTPDGIENVSALNTVYSAFAKAFGENTANKIFFENLFGFVSGFLK